MVDTSGFQVNTVFAPRVEGSAPPGYNPNGYCPTVKIDFNGVLHEFSLEELRRLDLYGKSADERFRILSDYLSTRRFGTKGNFMSEARSESQSVSSKQSTPLIDYTPKIGVKFKFPQLPIKLVSFYHRVILTRDFLILVYDTRAVGFQRVELPEDCEVYITIPEYKLIDTLAVNLGISFVDMDMEYTIFKLLGTEIKVEEEADIEKEFRDTLAKLRKNSSQEEVE